jgi:L-fuconolactonase
LRPIEDVLGALAVGGVERAVLVQPLNDFDNDYLLGIGRESGRFAIVGLVDPRMERPATELERLAGLGLRGIRITGDVLDDDPEFCASAARAGLVLVVHASRGMLTAVTAIRKVREAEPEARVVVAHLGLPQFDETGVRAGWSLLELAADPNVWVTLSGLGLATPYPYSLADAFVTTAISRFGASRLMWGSNFPLVTSDHYRDELDRISAGSWSLTPEQATEIRSSTADALWFAGR